MHTRALLLVVFLFISAGCSKEMPNVQLVDGSGEETDLQSILNDSDHLVLVFLVGQRCPLTVAGANIVGEFSESEPLFTAFAGLLVDGSGEQARAFREENGLPYPVYGLNRRGNALDWNDVVRNVGSKRRQLYGGTIAVVDSNLRIRYSVDREKIRDAPARLDRMLGD